MTHKPKRNNGTGIRTGHYAETHEAGGKKLDAGKLLLHLIPTFFSEVLARVMEYGAITKEYGLHNWKQGMPHTRLYNAARRHLDAWLNGEDIDESGLHHLWHAATCVLFLCWMQKFRPDLDDRGDAADQGRIS